EAFRCVVEDRVKRRRRPRVEQHGGDGYPGGEGSRAGHGDPVRLAWATGQAIPLAFLYLPVRAPGGAGPRPARPGSPPPYWAFSASPPHIRRMKPRTPRRVPFLTGSGSAAFTSTGFAASGAFAPLPLVAAGCSSNPVAITVTRTALRRLSLVTMP